MEVRNKVVQQHFPGPHENLKMRPALQDPPKIQFVLRRIQFPVLNIPSLVFDFFSSVNGLHK